MLAAAYVLFRPRSTCAASALEDEQRMRVLLAGYGDARLARLLRHPPRQGRGLLPDPAKSAVTYRVVSGVSLASGDPIGDAEAWPGAIEAWLDEARHYGWIPAVMGAERARRRRPTRPPG